MAFPRKVVRIHMKSRNSLYNAPAEKVSSFLSTMVWGEGMLASKLGTILMGTHKQGLTPQIIRESRNYLQCDRSNVVVVVPAEWPKMGLLTGVLGAFGCFPQKTAKITQSSLNFLQSGSRTLTKSDFPESP